MATKSTKHYDITQWADFVRGLAAAETSAMQQHLASGCSQCSRIKKLLERFAAATAADAACQVPEYVAHSARAIFALQQPEKVHILPRILARLIYDSFREPLPVGVRSRQHLSRQAMYEAGDYCVDLRLEQERGASQVTMVGQILNRSQEGLPLQDVPVMLMSGKEVVGRAVSNRFGEFQMEYQPRKHLRLYVPVQGNGKRIEVSLNGLESGNGEGKNPA
jgi:hypothetical protein